MNFKVGEVHTCDLEMPSTSCIPQLSPKTGHYWKFLRKFQKLFIVSRVHYNTHLTFRSTAQIVAERRRHHQTSHWYIIHPYSTNSVIWQTIMSIVWLILFFCEPLDHAFYHPFERRHSTIHKIIYYLDIFYILHVFLQFIYGYVVPRTQEIVLSPKKIAIKYLKSFFIFDLIGCVLPVNAFLVETSLSVREPYPKSITYLSALRQCRAVRTSTLLTYLKTITNFLGFSDTDHHFFCLVLIGIFLLHWSACTLHVSPRVKYHPNIPETSWLVIANLTTKPPYYAYIVSLHTATMYFFNAGTGIVIIKENFDRVLFASVAVVGMSYMIVVIAYFLEIVSSVSASEGKYEELLVSLGVFATKMKLPAALKNRLLCYYEHKFQKKYFKEVVLQAQMSEHLKFEVILHSCRNFISKMELFQGMSKTVLGKILACLKTEIYLPNDVVYDPAAVQKNIYFIGYGSLALYTTEGVEICHFHDGNHFGAITIILPEFSDTLSVVTVETSEIYILSGEDFTHMYNNHQDFALRIKESIKRRVDFIDVQLRMVSRFKNRHDVMHELRRGKILQRNDKRKARLTTQ